MTESEPAVQPTSTLESSPMPKINSSLTSPKPVVVSHRNACTAEALRSWSRWIRDVLAPLLTRESYTVLSADTISNFRAFFADLHCTTVMIDHLRYSRIHSALEEIVEQKTRWPAWIVEQAGEFLRAWEEELGSLQFIRADLWGPGGRLAGVTKLNEGDEGIMSGNSLSTRASSNGEIPSRDKSRKSSWNVKGGEGPSKAYAFGHNGVTVGDWWIKPAAAHRDGVIHASTNGITANKDGAYAIVMTENEEVNTGRHEVIKYRASQAEPGRFKLMQGVATRNPVRVLRTWRLDSQWAPKAGLRYDGLYRVLGYGVHLASNGKGEDDWQYTFELERRQDQDSFERSLLHPTADEMDDWKDYQRLKRRNKGEDLISLLFGTQERKSQESTTHDSEADRAMSFTTDSMIDRASSIAAIENMVERTLSVDSGYFSRRESKTAIWE